MTSSGPGAAPVPSSRPEQAAGEQAAGEQASGEQISGEPPVTGRPAVDEALGRLADLARLPVGEHHERLAGVHEALHAELTAPDRTDDD